MGIHLYCITPANTQLPPVRQTGIGGSPLLSVTSGDLAALVSLHATPPAAALDAIRVHNEVIAAAMDDHVTPVPIRFGQWLIDEDAVRAALDEGAARWSGMLGRFAGCAEFAIRIFDPALPDAKETPRPRTGRAYMEALAARAAVPAARHEEAVGALGEVMQGLHTEVLTEPLRTQHGVASVAYLVHRRDFDAYHTAVERVRMHMPHLRYLSTGPWPPYSFVS